jgi:hypothetical protein
MREGCLGSSQLTSEKKPRFSGSNQPLPMPLIVFRLREFLVGLRSTLGGCQHCIPAVTCEGAFIANGQGASLFKTEHTHEIIQNETLSFKKIIVSGLGGCAECHLQCTANIRVVAAIGNLPARLPRELSSRPLISSAMDGRAFTFRMIKSKIFWPDRFDQLYPVSNPNA